MFAIAVFAVAACGASLARDEPRPFAAAIGDAIESCVDSTTLRFGKDERRAVLDALDTETVGEALLRRYPAFAQSGLAPQAIVLWRKPGADWLYITLLVNPGKPGEACFTASFVASKISVTPVMLKKYFGVVAT
ncbi:MAG: hypothetical protein K8R60_21340 [Burkholderiales bacterium]|nr:hypothetical protein [Burkholderiales bacterium]